MLRHTRTDSTNKDFIELVRELDQDLAIRDGDDHGFYHQFNKIDSIQHVVVLYDNQVAVACGAIKKFDESRMEVKRMYTKPTSRGKGFASTVLHELEQWARELFCEACLLETGLKQPEAIRLYEKNGYSIIPNYGQYAGVQNSVCFEKQLLERSNEAVVI
jgi:putative acetyltransferase